MKSKREKMIDKVQGLHPGLLREVTEAFVDVMALFDPGLKTEYPKIEQVVAAAIALRDAPRANDETKRRTLQEALREAGIIQEVDPAMARLENELGRAQRNHREFRRQIQEELHAPGGADLVQAVRCVVMERDEDSAARGRQSETLRNRREAHDAELGNIRRALRTEESDLAEAARRLSRQSIKISTIRRALGMTWGDQGVVKRVEELIEAGNNPELIEEIRKLLCTTHVGSIIPDLKGILTRSEKQIDTIEAVKRERDEAVELRDEIRAELDEVRAALGTNEGVETARHAGIVAGVCSHQRKDIIRLEESLREAQGTLRAVADALMLARVDGDEMVRTARVVSKTHRFGIKEGLRKYDERNELLRREVARYQERCQALEKSIAICRSELGP